jgi:co-chaperonin GroES (HSP10)
MRAEPGLAIPPKDNLKFKVCGTEEEAMSGLLLAKTKPEYSKCGEVTKFSEGTADEAVAVAEELSDGVFESVLSMFESGDEVPAVELAI